MLHSLISDSPTYLASGSNGHPLAQAFYWVMRPFGLDAAALVQMALIVIGAEKLTISLKPGYKMGWAIFLVLCAPAFYWGRQIGSDALGYALFLMALSSISKTYNYGLLATLATLTRFQYIALFAGFLTYKRTAWIPIAMSLGMAWVAWTGWNSMLGMYGKVYKTVEYTACAKPIQPSDMSDAEFFNMVWGGHYIVPMADKNEVCVKTSIQLHKPIGSIWKYRDVYFKLIVSKVRNSFLPHQALMLCLLVALSKAWRVGVVCLAMYAFVLLTSTMMYGQYTLMVECVLVALGLKLWEDKA